MEVTRVSGVNSYITLLFKAPPEAGVKDPATPGLTRCEATGLCEDPAKTRLCQVPEAGGEGALCGQGQVEGHT